MSHLWTSEWGYKCLFSTFSSTKAGVGILFNNNFELRITKSFIDAEGRYIICDLNANGKNITLINLYAPNEDDPNFFKSLFEHVENFQRDEIVIGGDFNLVLDIDIDKKGGTPKTHTNARKSLHEEVENLDLVDAWRVLNPDVRKFTWRQKQPEVHCRLDFFLVSQSFLSNVTFADILPGFKTDHSMITLNISLHTNPRGRGFWKLNTSLLTNTDYIDLIKMTILQTQKEYENDPTTNPALLWDMIKLKVREKSIIFAAGKKRQTVHREQMLEEKIASLEKELEQSPSTTTHQCNIASELESCKKELEAIIRLRTQGAILRCKARWYNEGEKNTKYFLNLEKRHFKLNTISQLQIKEHEFVTSDTDILTECETFYKKLFTSQGNIISPDDEFFKSFNDTVLTDDDCTSCEGMLTEKECLEALKNMDSDKSPGTDGLPAEFYKTFWDDLSSILIDALNYGYNTGQLSITQRRGIIKLIPKKDSDPHLIKNWRPITLLNCDYKIAAKAIANRVKAVIPGLINNDQTGFLKGRFIGENVRLIDNIIDYTSQENIPGLLLFIDFEKAFDSLEWLFIERTLEYFGFGPSLMNWTRTFYNNTESCVLNNGWSSNFFKPQRGVRQGCPLSPYLFILSVEILAKAIRSNPNIKGISVNNTEIKLSQYADDTTLILNGTHESLSAALATINKFGNVSGLKLNDKKTEALWIGSMTGKKEKILPESNFKWPEKKVKVLGVWISTDPITTLNINYNEKVEKIRNILNCWKHRRLSLIGKILVIKSLLASHLTYILAPLATNQNTIREINDIFYDFLWNKKGDKIKRTVLINDYDKGGLKMIDLTLFNKSMKSTWIQKYLDTSNRGKWKEFFELEFAKFGGNLIFKGNLNKMDCSKIIPVKNSFIRELLEIWSEVSFEDAIKNRQHFLEQPLWHNSLIRIDNKPIFDKKLSLHGVFKVKNLMKDSSSYLSYKDFTNTYKIHIDPLKYCGLISAAKHLYKHSNLPNEPNVPAAPEPFLTQFLKSPKGNKAVYKKLASCKSAVPVKSQTKWIVNIAPDESGTDVDWRIAYTLAARCTKSTMLINFQYRLLHRILPTNSFLTKIGIKQDPNCFFCNNCIEDLAHLFWQCEIVKLFWNNLIEKLQNSQLIPSSYPKDIAIFLGLKSDTSKFSLQLNFCFLLARHYIWCCRSTEKLPHLKTFLAILKSQFSIEAHKPKSNLKKWDPLIPILNST